MLKHWQMLAPLAQPTRRPMWGLNGCTKDLEQSRCLTMFAKLSNTPPNMHKTLSLGVLPQKSSMWTREGRAALGNGSSPSTAAFAISACLPRGLLPSESSQERLTYVTGAHQPVSHHVHSYLACSEWEKYPCNWRPTAEPCTGSDAGALCRNPLMPSSRMSPFIPSLCGNLLGPQHADESICWAESRLAKTCRFHQILRNRLDTQLGSMTITQLGPRF